MGLLDWFKKKDGGLQELPKDVIIPPAPIRIKDRQRVIEYIAEGTYSRCIVAYEGKVFNNADIERALKYIEKDSNRVLEVCKILSVADDDSYTSIEVIYKIKHSNGEYIVYIFDKHE